jgi:glycosyltransferase involved in cell wall biosynthesis
MSSSAAGKSHTTGQHTTALPAAVGDEVKIAVVIPCYKIKRHIGGVLSEIPADVHNIYCVDDACPQSSGAFILSEFAADPRVTVIARSSNGGVGAAVISGYERAMEDGMDIVIKLDGDGQMDPALIPVLIRPLLAGTADYVKGNRYYSPESLRGMPMIRKLGNTGLSFLSKLSTGYWHLFDPTNGYTAIDARVLRLLPLSKLHRGYFFESDMLFRLNLLRACAEDIPMNARYADEKSQLSVSRALLTFPFLHLRNLLKRIVYNHFLRNFSIASVELLLGSFLLPFGVINGILSWMESASSGEPATAGTVMLAALPVIVGVQFLLNYLAYDFSIVPTRPISNRLAMHFTRRDS